ncbi:MAG: cupin domain-containing protein [Chloroflexota bacterium]
MAEYLRRLDDIPGFSVVPLPGHDQTRAFDKILIDRVTGSSNFMLLWCRLAAGSGAESHTHPSEQGFYILSGTLKVTIAGEDYIAGPNSSVFVPAGVEHSTRAEGEEPAVFLGILSPPMDFDNRPH